MDTVVDITNITNGVGWINKMNKLVSNGEVNEEQVYWYSYDNKLEIAKEFRMFDVALHKKETPEDLKLYTEASKEYVRINNDAKLAANEYQIFDMIQTKIALLKASKQELGEFNISDDTMNMWMYQIKLRENANINEQDKFIDKYINTPVPPTEPPPAPTPAPAQPYQSDWNAMEMQ